MTTKRCKTIINPLADHAGYHLRRASSVIMADLSHRLADLNLRPAEASVLLLIGANPGITQSEAGAALGIQRANMTPLVSRLAERGLVTGAPVDGRSIGFRLSNRGETVSRDAGARMQDHDARFLGNLPPDQHKSLIALLAAIADGRH